MIGESLLGLLAVLACTAGVLGRDGYSAAEIWEQTYHDWGSMQGLGNQVGVFITGAAHFIEQLGSQSTTELATAFIAVVVVSFALTTLDSATRLLRFNISEIGETLGWRILDNRYVASGPRGRGDRVLRLLRDRRSARGSGSVDDCSAPPISCSPAWPCWW